jgi:hypothetical protein
MPSMPGIAERVEISSITHNNGQHVYVLSFF